MWKEQLKNLKNYKHEMSEIKTPDKKVAWEIFYDPDFYFALIPHAITIFLVVVDNLSYAVVLAIFGVELIADFIFHIFALSITGRDTVQRIYRTDLPKFLIILKSFVTGILFISFFSLFALIVLKIVGSEDNFLRDWVASGSAFLVVGVYLVSKLISLIKNTYKYLRRQRPYIDEGKSLGINLVTLIVFVLLTTPPLWFIGRFIPNIQLVLSIFLLALKGYIDAAVVAQNEKIEDSVMGIGQTVK